MFLNKSLGSYACYLSWCLAASVAATERPEFILPVACDYGVDCVIQNYMDNDPTEAWRDYQCGQQTYNGHTGTDIRITNLPRMVAGVPVLAAADGKVIATRDGIPDTYLDPSKRVQISKTGLGNAVVIEHPNGWRTIYGHLKQGSLLVQRGDRVSSAQPLGEIGLSGLTEFPHVHFQVQHLGEITDPFTGTQPPSSCGDTANNLWRNDIVEKTTYLSGFVLDYGFNDLPPANYREIESGEFNNGVDQDSEYLFFWVRLIGLSAGDQVTLSISSPDNTTVKSRTFNPLKTSKAQIFYFMGVPNLLSENSGYWQTELILQRGSLPDIRQTFSYIPNTTED